MNSRLAATALACLVAVAGTGVASAQTLTIAVRNGPESMDPQGSTLGAQVEAVKHVFDPLVWANADLSLAPGLAESWAPLDESTWEFKLRPGVKFHDGSTLDASDVKASIERVPNAGGTSPMTQMVRRIASVEVVDDLTVHIKTNGPAPTLPVDLNRLFIIPSEFADATTEDFNSGTATIGTGPFKFQSWEPRGDLVLVRNEDYWAGPSAWEQVVRKEIPADAARVAALLSGSVDVISAVPATDVAIIAANPEFTTFTGDTIYMFNLQLDQREAPPRIFNNDGSPVAQNPFLDDKIREAMDLAINREAIAGVVLEGLAKPADNIVYEGVFGDPADLAPKAYDLERARQLVAESAWPDGFKVDLHCTNDRFPGDGDICQAVGQMLAAIKIAANVQAVSRTVYFPEHGRLEYSLSLNGWGTSTGEAGFAVDHLLHSPNPDKGLGIWNRNLYIRPENDAKIEQAGAELSQDTRRALFEDVFRQTIADRAWLPIVQLKTVWGAKSGIVVTPRVDEETLAYLIRPSS